MEPTGSENLLILTTAVLVLAQFCELLMYRSGTTMFKLGDGVVVFITAEFLQHWSDQLSCLRFTSEEEPPGENKFCIRENMQVWFLTQAHTHTTVYTNIRLNTKAPSIFKLNQTSLILYILRCVLSEHFHCALATQTVNTNIHTRESRPLTCCHLTVKSLRCNLSTR